MKKTILTLVALVGVLFSASADKKYTVETLLKTVDVVNYDKEYDAYIQINKKSTDSVSLGWELYQNGIQTLYDGGFIDYNVCDDEQCYTGDVLPKNSKFSWFDPQVAVMKVALFAKKKPSVNDAIISFILKDKINTANVDTIVFKYNFTTLSFEVVNNVSNSVQIYPNPVQGNTLFINSLGLNATNFKSYEVISLSGAQIAQNQLTNNNQIEVNTIPNGVYFLKLYANDGAIAIKKFVK